jgi:hypothetical protein
LRCTSAELTSGIDTSNLAHVCPEFKICSPWVVYCFASPLTGSARHKALTLLVADYGHRRPVVARRKAGMQHGWQLMKFVSSNDVSYHGNRRTAVLTLMLHFGWANLVTKRP